MKPVTQIPCSPSVNTILEQQAKLSGSLVAVTAIVSALKQHKDPMVVAMVNQIGHLALNDWQRGVEKQLESLYAPDFDDYEYSLSGGPKYFAIETKNHNEIEIREKPGNSYSQITIAFVDGTVENPSQGSYRAPAETKAGFVLNDEKIGPDIKREIKAGDVVCLFGHRITVVP